MPDLPCTCNRYTLSIVHKWRGSVLLCATQSYDATYTGGGCVCACVFKGGITKKHFANHSCYDYFTFTSHRQLLSHCYHHHYCHSSAHRKKTVKRQINKIDAHARKQSNHTLGNCPNSEGDHIFFWNFPHSSASLIAPLPAWKESRYLDVMPQ